jgi:hypothetical protein
VIAERGARERRLAAAGASVAPTPARAQKAPASYAARSRSVPLVP